MEELFLLSGVGMLLVALLSVVYWKLKRGVAIKFFFWGALFWFVGVGLKFAWGLPLNQPIINFIKSIFPAVIAGPVSWIYVGLLTGIFECGMILLSIYLVKSLRKATWDEANAYGIGFGAIEAFILGAISILRIMVVLFISDQLPQDILDTLALPESYWQIPIPVIERMSALFIHIFTAVAIFYAYITRKWSWFWISFGYKTIVDVVAAYLHLAVGISNLTLTGWWIVQGVFVILAIAGIIGLRIVPVKWHQQNSSAEVIVENV